MIDVFPLTPALSHGGERVLKSGILRLTLSPARGEGVNRISSPLMGEV